MGKNKLEKFADMASYPHVFEYPYSAVDNVPFDMKGKWHKEFFKNDNFFAEVMGCNSSREACTAGADNDDVGLFSCNCRHCKRSGD